MRIATALLLITNFAPAAMADEPPDAIRGKAFIAGSDRLAARVTLHFFGRDAPLTTVVTDAGGRFRCPIPPGLTLGAVQDGQAGPSCWMEIQEAGRWTWEPIDSGSPFRRGMTKTQQTLWLRQTAAEAIMRQVKATWRLRGGVMNLEVECAPTGEVEVTVRGAGGAPMADHTVRVIPAWALAEIHMPVTVRYEGRTDGAGRFRMRWSEGLHRLRVIAPGEGFGATGAFEVRAGQLAHQEMPPLARLGSIAGRLDPKLAGPSTTVVLHRLGDEAANASCDPEGRFAMQDVLPGSYHLRLLRGTRPVATREIEVRLAPGQQVADIVLRPPPPASARVMPDGIPAVPQRRPGGGAGEVVLVEGTVRDEQGRGVAGASVYARIIFDGGMRMQDQVLKATADDRGQYQVRGPELRMIDSPTLIAHAEGRPPALAFAPLPGADGRPSTLDITLADAARGGSVRVTVIKDGKPMAGASVGLAPRDGAFSLFGSGLFLPGRGTDRDAAEALIHPAAVTGPDGVARFTGLFPGDYELAVAERGPARVRPWEHDQGQFFGAVPGLGVAEGRETTFAMAIHPLPCTVQLQVFRPDGKPVAGRSVSFSIVRGTEPSARSLALDGQGMASYTFPSSGLWGIDVRFRDSEMKSWPITAEPYYQAEALLPIAPGVTPDGPIRLVGVRREAGSLRVRLLDVDGRPARGTVEILRYLNQPEYLNQPDFAASTDDQGVVVFRDVPSGQHPLRGFIDGLTAPAPDPSSGPPPEDSALRGRAAVSYATVTVTPGREATAELRARRVGYVRGTLRPPAGHKVSEYIIIPKPERTDLEPQWRLDKESGEFLCGPLLPGTVRMQFKHESEGGRWEVVGVQAVEVPAGEVAHVEFRPEEPKPRVRAGAGRSALVSPYGPSVPESDLCAAVSSAVLDDGKTPAFAAQALLFVPGYRQPVSSGISDASGRLTWHGRWMSGEPEAGEHIDRPTVVVRIPGRTGAAILEIEAGRPVRATLPAPRTVDGRITFGGRPVDGRGARIRVVAAHTGRGVLDEALGLEATAQADGRFELRGLTLGRYTIQAARDGIWLSRSVELTIGADRDPPPLALDIPEPGAPLTLQVVDRAGRPVADQSIGLVRPEGPLASLWPSSLRTDPAGTLTLRGLEAGRHTILVGDGKERRDVVVPAAGEARPAVERLVVPDVSR